MNVTEFAEQIVFGTTLEDKLQVPGKLSFEKFRSVNVERLLAPGRPDGLQMSTVTGDNSQPPSDHQLENEKSRGRLLHFLANHELLATELMALVLLKFPEAPKAFRQGVLVTLQEEQEHTRMYLQRMEECGVEFGSFPLSGQFWRVVEPMECPMDFVSRLSLTFEQANLDYSLHFAKVFKQIGDLSTSTLLQKIYEDEIGHVSHGLHWFRQWKDPEKSDWKAYQESLAFPMSPQRGRGTRCLFNREGRKKAGLDDRFIDAMEVFRQSRGRAPTVRWFEPSAEAELAGAISQRESQLFEQLGKDLELVLLPMSKQDDIVLVREEVTRKHLKHLIDAGFDLPEFTLFSDRNKLAQRKLHDFSPWAWTPANQKFAQGLTKAVKHRPPEWNSNLAELFRKSWALEFQKEWLNDGPDWFADSNSLGIPVHSIEDIEASLETIASRGFSNAIFKVDLAASGRGQRRLSCQSRLTREDWAWINSVSRTQENSDDSGEGTCIGIVEPELNRLLDLSFLWDASNPANRGRFLGWTRSRVTAGRRYAGTQLGTPFSDCNDRLKRFLLDERYEKLRETQAWLQDCLVNELMSRNFQGYFGVDAFVFNDLDGSLKVRPLVELNPRITMGHVAKSLEKRLAPGVPAEFRIFSQSEWDESSVSKLESMDLVKSNDGYLKSGVVWLGRLGANTKLLPILLVGQDVIEEFSKGK